MKILLIAPIFKYNDNFAFLSASDFPVGLAYIASALKQAGHEVKGLNPNNLMNVSLYETLCNQLRTAIDSFKPELIGLGGLCTDFHFLRDAIEVIRRLTDAPIVLGGGIITNDAEFIFNYLKPDYCVIGEGEETIVKLSLALETKGNLEQVNNIGFFKDGKAVFTPREYYDDLDSRPFPDYDVFNIGDMIDNFSQATRILYKYPRENPRPIGIVTARSCCFKCSFCVSHSKYRARSIENIMEEIKVLYDKYKFNILIVQDELFAVNKKRMVEFCTTLIEKKKEFNWDFYWMFQTHANAKLDLETLKLAKESGCYFFSYGLESASPTVLKSMNKKTSVPQIVEAMNIAKESRIGFGGNLIFGDPAETEDTIQETLDFYGRYCTDMFIFMSFVMPYPDSKVFDYCIEKGIITDKKAYYENIDKTVYNMTSMRNEIWFRWVNFISKLEGMWSFLGTTDTQDFVKLEQDAICKFYNADMYHIEAVCPHCGEHNVYKQIFKGIGKRTFLGTGCTKCNKKIRINLKEHDGSC